MTAVKITRYAGRACAAVFGVLLAGSVVFSSWAADEAAPTNAPKAPEAAAAPTEKPAAPTEAAASAEAKPAAPEEPTPPPPPPEGGPPPEEKPADAPAAPAEAPAKDAAASPPAAAANAPAKDAPKDAAKEASKDAKPAAAASKAAEPAKDAASPAVPAVTPATATTAAPNGKSTPEHKGLSFETFRILIDRNIFSAKRVPKSAASAAAKDAAAKPKTQVLRLMGTYLTPERTLALFEGTDSVPGGGIKQGETIAGYRLEEVRVNGAVLSNDKGKIEVPVGSGLSQAEDKSWTLVDKPVVEHSAAASSAAQPGASPAAAANDPIEKLRARRRKELGQ